MSEVAYDCDKRMATSSHRHLKERAVVSMRIECDASSGDELSVGFFCSLAFDIMLMHVCLQVITQ